MRAVTVVVGHVLSQYRLQVSATEHEGPVQALASDGPHESFRVGVRLGCPNGGPDDVHTFGGEDLVERAGELRVAISDEKPPSRSPISASLMGTGKRIVRHVAS